MTGEARPYERLEDPVRNRRHQRQLCRPRLQKQSGCAGVHRKDETERLRVPVRARRASGAGQGCKNGRTGRAKGYPVQRACTVLYQHVQSGRGKAAQQHPVSAAKCGGVQSAGRQTHHLPLRQLRQTEPRSRPRKGAGHHAPCRGSAGRSRLCRYDSLPGNHGQDRPAGHTGRGAGAVQRG